VNVGDPDGSSGIGSTGGQAWSVRKLGWLSGSQIGHITDETGLRPWREGPWVKSTSNRKRCGINRISIVNENEINEDNAAISKWHHPAVKLLDGVTESLLSSVGRKEGAWYGW
jgi:hypothetical protein